MPRSSYLQLNAAISRMRHGEMYISEFFGFSFLQISDRIHQTSLKNFFYDFGMKLCVKSSKRRLLKYFDGKKFNFNNAYLPDVRSNDILFTGLSYLYNDLFKIHCEYNGDYNYKIVDPLDLRFSEGPYFYVGPDIEKILLKPGDVVVDAGAWIGDFSALAAHLVGKLGKVFAFEPSPQIMPWLQKTASFYQNIIIVPFGLGSSNQTLFYNDDEGGQGTFLNPQVTGSLMGEIKKLDDWVSENRIPRIDFIKADIEGFEREMLMGARGALRDFGPTLSICTYHLHDDPEVLEKIILEANPNYKVIQRQSKLFAYIPQVNDDGL
jgi:FkbM family methyltransferase